MIQPERNLMIQVFMTAMAVVSVKCAEVVHNYFAKVSLVFN